MAIDLKDKIKDAIDKHANDKNFLNEIYSLIKSYDKDIAGYDLKGNPKTYTSLQEELEAASNSRNESDYITSEQLRKKYSS